MYGHQRPVVSSPAEIPLTSRYKAEYMSPNKSSMPYQTRSRNRVDFSGEDRSYDDDSRDQFQSKRRVSFSLRNEIQHIAPDPKHDDGEFLRLSRMILKSNDRKMKENRSKIETMYKWMISNREKEEMTVEEMDASTMASFKEAFEHRLKTRPGGSGENISYEIEGAIFELAQMIRNFGGWPSPSKSKAEKAKEPDIGIVIDRRAAHKLSAQELASLVRKRISNNSSVESITSELKNLSRIGNMSDDNDIQEYCRKEINTLKDMLEDLGYVQG